MAERYRRGMQTARRDLRAIAFASSPIRRGVFAVLVLAFGVVLVLGVADAGRRMRSLDDRRDEALAARRDPADVAGDAAGAFRRFRSTLSEGDTFALAFGPDVDRDQKGFYRLVALSYLYPAVAVSDPAEADAMMVFGPPTPSIRGTFDEIAVVDGVWLGRRPGT
jgi:hypothetical protein